MFFVSGTKDQIQEIIRESVIPAIMDLILSADYDVKREACWALANAASGGTPQQVESIESTLKSIDAQINRRSIQSTLVQPLWSPYTRIDDSL